MDSPHQYPRSNPNREAKRGHNASTAPRKAQKDAYARLLSQHTSSKYSLYLYEKELSSQREGSGPVAPVRAQSDRMNIPQQRRDQVLDFSDSSDFSPSSLKSKGEETSLSLYMEKLSTRSGQEDRERKQGVSDRQRQGQRRDTTTSHDGDIDSGEELSSFKLNESKKQQRKNKELSGDFVSKEIAAGGPQSPRRTTANGQEQEKMKRSKKKYLPKNNEEEKSREGKRSVVDAQSPHGKDKNLQQPQGKL